MRINKVVKTDVLVMGSGFSGVIASIKAGQMDTDVCLVSSSNIFSGSSFYPGTWGFGLIAPEDKNDQEDLKNTINAVGMGMADPALVDTFVPKIEDSIEDLRKMGVQLKKAKNKGEKEFIPCFDHKNRNWNGIDQNCTKKALSQKLEECRVKQLPYTEIIHCIKEGNRIVGAIGISDFDGLVLIECKSFIIASGGFGGIFKYCLNTSDIKGMGQYLALNAGAKLINLEFMQMMPGFISPSPKTVYNEKVFKYSEFLDTETRVSIFDDIDESYLKKLLKLRSTHGPFTSRLESRVIDLKIFEIFSKNENGVTLRYKELSNGNQAEFVKLYFDWLNETKKLSICDEVQLGIYYHAANGGIKINSSCETGVEGLFACGEATGGMHGADRIGGLSTSNCLVFGGIAGESAAKYARNANEAISLSMESDIYTIPDAKIWIKKIQELNFKTAMIIRKEDKILNALNELDNIDKIVNENKIEVKQYEQAMHESIKDSYELLASLTVTRCLLNAIRLRKESRGPHFRVDYPKASKEYNQPIVIHKDINKGLCWN
jgi:L-aspartate oxidase